MGEHGAARREGRTGGRRLGGEGRGRARRPLERATRRSSTSNAARRPLPLARPSSCRRRLRADTRARRPEPPLLPPSRGCRRRPRTSRSRPARTRPGAAAPPAEPSRGAPEVIRSPTCGAPQGGPIHRPPARGPTRTSPGRAAGRGGANGQTPGASRRAATHVRIARPRDRGGGRPARLGSTRDQLAAELPAASASNADARVAARRGRGAFRRSGALLSEPAPRPPARPPRGGSPSARAARAGGPGRRRARARGPEAPGAWRRAGGVPLRGVPRARSGDRTARWRSGEEEVEERSRERSCAGERGRERARERAEESLSSKRGREGPREARRERGEERRGRPRRRSQRASELRGRRGCACASARVGVDSRPACVHRREPGWGWPSARRGARFSDPASRIRQARCPVRLRGPGLGRWCWGLRGRASRRTARLWLGFSRPLAATRR